MPTPSPDEIYELLKTVKFIDLNKTVKNTTRLNARTGKKPKRKSLNMTRSKLSLKNKPRFSGVFGKTMNPTSKWKPVPSALSRKYPNIHKKLFSYVKAHVPPKFKFDCITINHNLKCTKHIDSKNAPISLITSVGAFTGGELMLENPRTKEKLMKDTRNKFLLYNGKEWYHWNKPIKGDKFSIVAYNRHGKNRDQIEATEPKWIN